jgi:hypothetical protein
MEWLQENNNLLFGINLNKINFTKILILRLADLGSRACLEVHNI